MTALLCQTLASLSCALGGTEAEPVPLYLTSAPMLTSKGLAVYTDLQLPIVNPKPSTLNPEPSTLDPQPSTSNPQPSTLNPQPSTLNPQPSTLNPKP